MLATNATLSGLGTAWAGGLGTTPSSITTNRTINFLSAAANNNINVAYNTTLTLASPFGPTNNGFIKGEAGTLVLSANNDQWAGAISIYDGAVQVTNNAALGLGSVAVGTTTGGGVGGALQLVGASAPGGGLTIANGINLNQGTAIDPPVGMPINGAGSLESVSGTNTVLGSITQTQDAGVGADSGSTLNINGGINTAGHKFYIFARATSISTPTPLFRCTRSTNWAAAPLRSTSPWQRRATPPSASTRERWSSKPMASLGPDPRRAPRSSPAAS